MIELLLQAERAMSVGLIDRAGTLYAQVADADPQNSIAVVGLARVALERGDEAGALELARRALTIDRENAAAARMVERLEEVQRYREADAPSQVAPSQVAPSQVAPSDTVQLEVNRPEATISQPPVGPAAVSSQVEPAVTPSPSVRPSRWRALLDRLLRRR